MSVPVFASLLRPSHHRCPSEAQQRFLDLTSAGWLTSLCLDSDVFGGSHEAIRLQGTQAGDISRALHRYVHAHCVPCGTRLVLAVGDVAESVAPEAEMLMLGILWELPAGTQTRQHCYARKQRVCNQSTLINCLVDGFAGKVALALLLLRDSSGPRQQHCQCCSAG